MRVISPKACRSDATKVSHRQYPCARNLGKTLASVVLIVICNEAALNLEADLVYLNSSKQSIAKRFIRRPLDNRKVPLSAFLCEVGVVWGQTGMRTCTLSRRHAYLCQYHTCLVMPMRCCVSPALNSLPTPAAVRAPWRRIGRLLRPGCRLAAASDESDLPSSGMRNASEAAEAGVGGAMEYSLTGRLYYKWRGTQ